MEVDCKNEAIVKCIDEDGMVVLDSDSFSTEDTGVITYDFLNNVLINFMIFILIFVEHCR